MDESKRLPLPPRILERLRKKAEASGVPFRHPTVGDLRRGFELLRWAMPDMARKADAISESQELAKDIANLNEEQLTAHAQDIGVSLEDIKTLLAKKPEEKT